MGVCPFFDGISLILTTPREAKMKLRPCYKRVVPLFATIALMTLAGLARAAEFSAETTIDRLGQKQKVKVYVKGQMMREEMVDVFGQKQVLIHGPGEGRTFMLYPDTKTYMAIPAAAALSPAGEDEEALKKIGTRRLIGQETVNGYLCDKYEIVFHNTYRGKMILWVARKLKMPIRMIQVDGPPVGALNRELTNIKEGDVEDSLFRVPTDYRKVEKPAQGVCGSKVSCVISFY
jgi:hypothetical protein